jgi:hypothetical protein
MAEPPLDALVALEVELHRGAVRADRARLDALLHPDFVEFGRSGTVWTREATLQEFADGGTFAPRITADRFALQRLDDTLALLTYRSAHLDAQDRRHRFTLRSSLWQRDAAGRWQLRFHQGTPTEDASP